MSSPGTMLSALRVAVGASAWAAPNTTGKVFGLVAALLGARNGSLSKQTAVMAGGTAVLAAGLGAAALQAGE